MIDDELTKAVNALAKQLRGIDASIRQESKVIDAMKAEIKASRLGNAEAETEIDVMIDRIAALRVKKIKEVAAEQRGVLNKKNLARERTERARRTAASIRADVMASLSAFLEGTKEHQANLNACRIQAEIDHFKTTKASYQSEYAKLEDETKSALEKAASAKERRRKNSLQLEHLGEYISWLSQAKNKLREDQRDLDAQINRRRLEQYEDADESLVAADILSLQHQRQILQDRVDVLVTEFMHEQQEVATLRKALDRTQVSQRFQQPPRAVQKKQGNQKARCPRAAFVTASHLLGARGRRQSGSREDCAQEPSISRERPAAQSRSKRQKSRNGEANGASEAPTYVDVFGGKKFCYNAA